MEESKLILSSLSQNILCSDIMNSLVSYKDNYKKIKQPKKPKKETLEEEETESLHENSFSKEKTPKKLCTDSKLKIQEKSKINIFEIPFYINTETLIKMETKSEKKNNLHTTIELENLTKKLIPDYNFDTFDTKGFKKINEDLEKNDNEEDRDSHENETINDERCKKFSLEITHNSRNIIMRTKEQEENRRNLPIYLKETEIMDSINNNFVTIICGETGSGKSTQVPQFVYESGYTNKGGPNPGRIGITQPRRIAAIALAKRVADEMSITIGKEIAYQVRHETSSFDENTKIKFMTDGILLNEMTSDYLLSEYSVIIIDEAHERKINTDLLLGLLSRVVNIRAKNSEKERKLNPNKKKYENNPLRLIIMSATLRVEDFTHNKWLFPKKINVINVESRQFPVSIYYNKITPDNYMDEALKKCKKIHKTLPTGDVLVFLTGEKEIKEFCYKLEIEFSKNEDQSDEFNKDENIINNFDSKEINLSKPKEKRNIFDPDSDEEMVVEEEDEENKHQELKKEHLLTNKELPLCVAVYPLFSKLCFAEQERIFQSHAENIRMFVISTNVSETSLTIPNIKYVVDTGKEKKKIYNNNLLISNFSINWISQASANQRSGRAGRTGPGFCYRLYSTPVYGNLFQKFSDPEILNTPIESVILQLKAIGIANILKFPFPTTPNLNHIRDSIISLVKLKALQLQRKKNIDEDDEDENIFETIERNVKNNKDETNLTELGKVLVYIPLHPRYAKMILEARKINCLGYMLLIVCALSVDQLCINEKISSNNNLISDTKQNMINKNKGDDDDDDEEEDSFKNRIEMLKEKKEANALKKREFFAQVKEFKERYNKFMIGKSDLFFLMNLLGNFIEFMNGIKTSPNSAIEEFCKQFNLQNKNLKEIYYNFHQILDIISDIIESTEEKQDLRKFYSKYIFPNSTQQDLIIEILIENYIEKIARKSFYMDENNKKRAFYELLNSDEKFYIHPNSFLFASLPDFLIYNEVFFAKKYFMKNITIIQDISLLFKYDPNKDLTKVKYLNSPIPFYSEKKDEIVVWASSEFGKKKWDLNLFEFNYPEEALEQYYWFSYYLLNGNIFKYFIAFKKLYSDNIKIIRINSLAANVQRLVNKLKNSRINTKKKLIEKWENEKKFLLDEVLLWVKPEFHNKIKEKWPPSF